jgi:hypothetical protein
MMLYPAGLLGRLGRLLLDLMVVLWTGAWALIGWAAYRLVTGLEAMADAVTSTGQTLNGWIRDFHNAVPQNVPYVSSSLNGLANAMQTKAGDTLIHKGMAAHDAIAHLAVLLGLLVAILPVLVVVPPYLVWRVRDVRERTAALAFVQVAERTGRVAQASAVLAHRAVAVLPLRHLMRASSDPVGDLADGRHDALANAMLRRAGVPPLRRTSAGGRPPA